ncbi:MAG: 4Fe-4S ferredoxin [Deltaproteobacteria bacterium]|nr:4Fe-4S ferredoxin [Deltaproteobacteria bacterium]
MKSIFLETKHCLSCKTCEIYCAVAHSAAKNLLGALAEDPRALPRIRVKQTRTAKAMVALCRHCEKPACVASCALGALTKDPVTRLTIIDHVRCLGCELMPCVSGCPFGAIMVEKDKKIVLVCDQCVELGAPVCVSACPTGVFTLEATSGALVVK